MQFFNSLNMLDKPALKKNYRESIKWARRLESDKARMR